MDAAVAVLFCNGVVTSQSMGIGGGFIMTIHLSNGTAISLVAREMAPAAVTRDMFRNTSSTLGPRTSGVPGEVKGYWEAKQRFGNPEITWAELIQPSIDLCEKGRCLDFVFSCILFIDQVCFRHHDHQTCRKCTGKK